ncbi:MAG TPA: ABC transporter permease [Acidobacteriota bacterium]|nr:ABC transporter permease [Acidobacteriota bacterium]
MWRALAAPGLLWLLLFFVTPFYALLSVAMGSLDPVFSSAEPVWNPLHWNPAIFPEVLGELLGGRLGAVFLRTLVYVGTASALCLLIGYPVAYYIARHAGRRRGLMLGLIVTPFWINYLMRMMAWQNLLAPDGYVNRFLMFVNLLDAPRAWLVGHHETVILGLVYGYVPFLILPLFAALDQIDGSVLEAARDLGAGPLRTFLRVTLPLSKQGVLAGVVIIMLPLFGDYYTPNLLSGSPRTRMIGNEIDLFINSGVGGATGAALTVILMAFIASLMAYYLFTVMGAARETHQ